MAIIDLLRGVTFGARVAEEETDQLITYFVETDHWRRLINDGADIVYGPKGSGKSALFSLLLARKDQLKTQKILLVSAENPRGATVFRSLITDPPATEREFIALWKLYIAALISGVLQENHIENIQANKLRSILEESGLFPREKSLQGLLHDTFSYVKSLIRPESIEGGIKLDPITQMPAGITGKILFGEPTRNQSEKGIESVDNILLLANDAFSESKYRIWILLDRLDVAFSDSEELEKNALRALFHVYLDVQALRNIRLKIFLRTDIWRRIASEGFREASHITRHLTIEWNSTSLLNLLILRIIQNISILDYYQTSKEEILSSIDKQMQYFYRLFPDQVEAGKRKSTTLDWMLGRTRDGTKKTAPRELIHLLDSLKNAQIRHIEIGDSEPENGRLFSRNVFNEALVEVSHVRLEQTLYAEYPQVRGFVEKLRGEKTFQSIHSLSRIWDTDKDTTINMARYLVEIGLFEQRGEKRSPKYWIPMLYRNALDLVQGTAQKD